MAGFRWRFILIIMVFVNIVPEITSFDQVFNGFLQIKTLIGIMAVALVKGAIFASVSGFVFYGTRPF